MYQQVGGREKTFDFRHTEFEITSRWPDKTSSRLLEIWVDDQGNDVKVDHGQVILKVITVDTCPRRE